MQCTVLPHITASVFINDDESGLHHDYEVWLEKVCSRLHPAPHATTSQCRPGGRLHNPPAKLVSDKPLSREKRGNNADAHLKRNATRSVARDGPLSEAVVVAVTNGRLDGSTELAEVLGTWEGNF